MIIIYILLSDPSNVLSTVILLHSFFQIPVNTVYLLVKKELRERKREKEIV